MHIANYSKIPELTLKFELSLLTDKNEQLRNTETQQHINNSDNNNNNNNNNK
jgi:hypothetical protein